MSDVRDPGDAWVTAADGNDYWGRFGAAGLLAHDAAINCILLQHRAGWSHHGNTWGIPGGARHENEAAPRAAIRESQEEAGVPDNSLTPRFTHVLDRGGWTYTTLIADVRSPFEPVITDAESHALAWVPLDSVEQLPLHPGFAASWPLLRPLLSRTPTVVVDAANVVGSVPDGWWKDRRAAATRLRDRLTALSISGVRSGFLGLPDSEIPGLSLAFPDWVLVTEGVARGIGSTDAVAVVDAPDLGDDEIVQQVSGLTAHGASVTVVTSDAELKLRCLAAGATDTRGAKKLVKQLQTLDAD